MSEYNWGTGGNTSRGHGDQRGGRDDYQDGYDDYQGGDEGHRDDRDRNTGGFGGYRGGRGGHRGGNTRGRGGHRGGRRGNTGNRGGHNGDRRSIPVCYRCHQPGHIRDNCPENDNGGQRSTSNHGQRGSPYSSRPSDRNDGRGQSEDDLGARRGQRRPRSESPETSVADTRVIKRMRHDLLGVMGNEQTMDLFKVGVHDRGGQSLVSTDPDAPRNMIIPHPTVHNASLMKHDGGRGRGAKWGVKQYAETVEKHEQGQIFAAVYHVAEPQMVSGIPWGFERPVAELTQRAAMTREQKLAEETAIEAAAAAAAAAKKRNTGRNTGNASFVDEDSVMGRDSPVPGGRTKGSGTAPVPQRQFVAPQFEKRSNRQCDACNGFGHDNSVFSPCTAPSTQGDVVACWMHNTSAVYGPNRTRKGPNYVPHTLNGPRGELPQCSNWRVQSFLAKFKNLVENRSGIPPLRVTDKDACFIKLTLRMVDEEYGGVLPEGFKWPLLKEQCCAKSGNEKYIKLLRSWYTLDPINRPFSALDCMELEDIKRKYASGELQPQVYPRDGPIAPLVSRNSDDGGDYIMQFGTEKPKASPFSAARMSNTPAKNTNAGSRYKPRGDEYTRSQLGKDGDEFDYVPEDDAESEFDYEVEDDDAESEFDYDAEDDEARSQQGEADIEDRNTGDTDQADAEMTDTVEQTLRGFTQSDMPAHLFDRLVQIEEDTWLSSDWRHMARVLTKTQQSLSGLYFSQVLDEALDTVVNTHGEGLDDDLRPLIEELQSWHGRWSQGPLDQGDAGIQ